VRGDLRAFEERAASALSASGTGIEEILSVPPGTTPIGLASDTPTTWFRVREGSQQNAWDRAYTLVSGRVRQVGVISGVVPGLIS